jgi:hypothetical protein
MEILFAIERENFLWPKKQNADRPVSKESSSARSVSKCPVAEGRVHKMFVASNGTAVILRAKTEDLDAMMGFANGLVEEQRKGLSFGTLIDGPATREEEARWLAEKLLAIEAGREVGASRRSTESSWAIRKSSGESGP